MTDENTTEQNDSSVAPVRRTRARRAATAPVTTPAPSAPTVERTPVEESDASTPPPAKAPRKRASRKTATAPQADASPTATDQPEIDDAGPTEGSADADRPEPAAAPRKRSRRATSQVTDTTTAAAPVSPEPDASAAEQKTDKADGTGATERPQRSRRASRSRASSTPTDTASTGAAADDAGSTDPAPAPADGADETAVAPRRTRGGRGRRGGEAAAETLDVLGELGAGRDGAGTAGATTGAAKGDETQDAPPTDAPPTDGAPEDDTDDAAEEAPRPTTTALLFQAPDPTSRPRRRRAQAPAGPPKPVDAVEDDASDETGGEEEKAAEPTAAAPARRRSRRSAQDTGADSADDADRGASRGAVSASDATSDDAETRDDDESSDDSEDSDGSPRRRRRRGGRGRRSRSGGNDRGDNDRGDEETKDESGDGPGTTGGGDDAETTRSDQADDDGNSSDESGEGDDSEGPGSSSRRRRRRRRGSRSDGGGAAEEQAASSGNGRSRSRSGRTASDEVTALKGSTRLEAKRQRRREGRDAGRRRTVVTEAEFLARRESVDRSMVVREADGRVQIAVLEDKVLVEHFVSRSAQNAQSSMAGNVYLGRVQNVLPSMEAAFVDVGKGRNAVLYAGEVNWDAAGLEGQPRRIEQALKSGDSVLVQVTKDPIGHKGARLTSQITLAGRYLVYVPAGGMTGISRKLPENERARLKKLLKEIVPDAAGVIVRTAAEGASEDELRRDVQRLQDQWAAIQKKAKTASAPALLQGEPDLAIRVVRDIFNDDFGSLVVQGDEAWTTIKEYVDAMAPDLAAKVSRWEQDGDVFTAHRIDEQLAKGMDRKVYLPSGGSLVIDRTEAMTVVDVNTGKFTGSGGTLEETVTRNNLEAAEEIVRQLRLRDIGGIIVIDFIDMVLESNRDLVLRRLVECLGRDRTKHQVAEVTSLGLVQMTRKRVGQGLVEAFSETCEHCNGRGFIVHTDPIDAKGSPDQGGDPANDNGGHDTKRNRRKKAPVTSAPVSVPVLPEAREAVKATLATIAAAAAHAHEHGHDHEPVVQPGPDRTGQETDVVEGPTAEAGDRGQDQEAAPEGAPVGLPPAADAELTDTVESVEAVEVGQTHDGGGEAGSATGAGI